ncbi:hypothetical protein [Rhodobacter calidifons]|uniref:hypothetical protein n=1 Tax=Rhodobacter calidifons TaxID=2715277 RepID=UPI001F62502F|nr:hypothetical protein [Rhodobacter calidifons]
MGESQDDPALRARQMSEALYARINPRHELSEPARRYAYSTPVDMAKELLTLRGESTMALSPATLVTRALHTTSDFPIILGDTVGRVLRDAYQAAPSGIRRLGRQTTARDFRAVNKIMLTYASDGEMATALTDLNRQIAGATERISVVRIQSSKGF